MAHDKNEDTVPSKSSGHGILMVSPIFNFFIYNKGITYSKMDKTKNPMAIPFQR